MSDNVIIKNRKARHNYEILETMVAGMILKGYEAKSISMSRVSISESFVDVRDGECFLVNSHIDPYEYTHNSLAGDPYRKRKLLLNKSEINKLDKKVREKGLSIVPLSIKRINGKFKLEIALCRGKKNYDKRHDLKEKQSKIDIKRESKYGR
jgi:SsrA-binding protein